MRKNADELWRKNVGQIMKLYTALFLMLIMAVSAMGIVTAQVRLIQVQNLHKSIVAEVKGSNCDRTVIESCFDRAQNTECSLIITFYKKKGKIETLSGVIDQTTGAASNRKIRGCTKAAGKNSRGRNCKNRNGDASALSCI